MHLRQIFWYKVHVNCVGWAMRGIGLGGGGRWRAEGGFSIFLNRKAAAVLASYIVRIVIEHLATHA